jgi:hypothetical protein
MAILMHYEVELRELTYESDGTGGLQVTGSMWKPVRMFNKVKPRPARGSSWRANPDIQLVPAWKFESSWFHHLPVAYLGLSGTRQR